MRAARSPERLFYDEDEASDVPMERVDQHAQRHAEPPRRQREAAEREDGNRVDAYSDEDEEIE